MTGTRKAMSLLSFAAALLVWLGAAQAQTPVDVALVLTVDSSGSIDAEEFKLQKEGIALAITNGEVLKAIGSGRAGRIAIAYVEWGGPLTARTIVEWMLVNDLKSAEAFAAAVLAAPRSPQSYNAIGDAIDHSVALLGRCPCQAARRVIDVSGDNADMRSVRPVTVARDDAVARGIIINALAVLDGDPRALSGASSLVEYYEANVIGGQGAFVIAAKDRADFTRAMRQKMIQEIAGLAAPRNAIALGAD